MDQTLISVMKSIRNAQQLDSYSNYQEAYIKYSECVLSIVSNLLHKVKTDGGKVIVSKEVIRHIQLGQQCMDRLAALVQTLESVQNAARSQSQPLPNTAKMAAQDQGRGLQTAKRFSEPVPPLHPDTSPYSFSRKHGHSPMELAYIRNQQIMSAYKSRLARMNKGSQATLSLTIQRKMAENLAIAKAQEQALAKKMNERQNRLEEQAKRRFSAPMGMSEDEQEQRQNYKKILEYEQDAKWLSKWRQKLEDSPEDPIVINQLIQEILRCSDHPLTVLLKKYQLKVYEMLYPLVSNKLNLLKDITVPLPSYLHPPSAQTGESKNASGEKPEEISDSETEGESIGRVIEEPTETSGRKEEDLAELSGREIEEQTDTSGRKTEEQRVSDVEDMSNDSEDNGNEKTGGDSEHENKSLIMDQGNISSTSKTESNQDVDEFDESEVSKVINEVVNSDLGDEDDSCDECSLKTMDELVEESKENVESALAQGKKLERQLTIESEKANSILTNVSEYEKYMEENMDDLFDDEGDDVDPSESFHSLPTMNNPSINSAKRSTSLPHDKSFPGRDSSTEDLPKTGTMPKSMSMDSGPASLPSDTPALRSSLSLESMKDSDISKLSEEAYQRHLMGISHDIHGFLEKLLLMFVIAYEKLDSPTGRDQCYASLEEPFFKPIWKYILALFRLVNRTREKTLAYKMTTKDECEPKDFSVKKKLWLVSRDGTNKPPYKKAILELQKVKEYYTMLSKLECVVRVCREVCACVEDYYSSGEDESGRKTPPSVGADDLLPILSYVVIQSKLPQLVSECQAMEEFIHEGYIMGEEGYCLTSLQTAINFLTSVESDV